METKRKIIVVPSNGQISIGKEWAGKQILVEDKGTSIVITEGTFVPRHHETFYTEDAHKALEEFEAWTKENKAQKTDSEALKEEAFSETLREFNSWARDTKPQKTNLSKRETI
jgi:hypothetical protein